MKNLFNDLVNFLGSLTTVDIIFFVAIMVLIILIVTMYYIVRINTWDDDAPTGNGKKDKSIEINENTTPPPMIEDKEETEIVYSEEGDLSEDILNAFSLPKAEDEPEELLDLKTITKAIEYGQTQSIDVSAYEEEQEQKAIISYQELLSKHSSVKLNYKEEIEEEGVSVKKIDLNNLTSKITKEEEDVTVATVTVISYDKEEAFLSALKHLQNQLT